MIEQITWARFKEILASTNINWIYVEELSDNYSTLVNFGGFTLKAYLTNNTADHTEFLADYKDLAFKLNSDTNGRPFVQNVIAPKGWGYIDLSFNFKLNETGVNCSKLTFDVSRDLDGATDFGGLSEEFLKSDFTKIVSPVASDFTNNIRWRRIDFEPTFDYVIVGGRFSVAAPTDNHGRVWCYGAPDVPSSLGGSHPFMVEKSLTHITKDQSFIADGRTAKLMPYDATYHTNKLTAFLNHELSESGHIEISYQMYVAPGSVV